VIILVHTITPRLRYISHFIGQQLIGEAFELVTDPHVFRQSDSPKINYTGDRISVDDFWIQPHGLLFETNHTAQMIKCFETNGHKAFFPTAGDLPFDIFAATFYLLSRYEEYGPHQKDMYGRYAHENSLAYKENFLHQPLINLWLIDFKKAIQKKFSLFTTHHSPPDSYRDTILPTYDIDEAWSYQNKDGLRTAGGIAKAIITGRWAKVRERRKVLQEKVEDPYDSYEWMDKLHSTHKLEPRYFFLVADKTGKYDRNTLPKEKMLQELIRRHAENYAVGIHPSWQSGDDPALIKKEIQTIEKITGKKIYSSRQHYIRFTLPVTFRLLMDAGIREDFSMGYGSINGFRASVASPFYWYDLEKEETTNLLLYPFCFMDANSFFEQKFSAQQALEEMRQYYQAVRSVNGIYISIWHNSFLGREPLFAGWREVYEQFIKEVSA
jgi:hypothetical protein